MRWKQRDIRSWGTQCVRDRPQTGGTVLYTGRKEEVSGFVDDYFRKISNGSLQSVLLRQYVLMDLYVSAVSVLEKADIPVKICWNSTKMRRRWKFSWHCRTGEGVHQKSVRGSDRTAGAGHGTQI